MSSPHPAERRQLTVMLCDLVAWTALAQRLDPEDLAELIQSYRQRCRAVVAGHGGTIAQYVGDGVLAYFGYPRAHEDDAERAIRAALGIAEAERSAAGDSNVHIGIATGIVVIGGLAAEPPAGRSAADVEVSAVGSALNLAARLQTLAEPGMVVIAEGTRRLAGGIFEYTALGQHELKGFAAPVQAWQVIGERDVRSRFHALRASSLTPLVDRRDELRRLQQLWEDARGGHGKAVLLTAEAGGGKSRLAEVVAGRVVGRECMRLWYYCSANLRSTPLAPVLRYLSFAAGLSDKIDDATKRERLLAFLPETLRQSDETVALLAGFFAIPMPGAALPPMSPHRHKQRLLSALTQLLEAFAARSPLLLIVEDLHWIDPSSDELIGMIVERLASLPILAILTARPEFEVHWDERHLMTMPLGPLAPPDAKAMIASLCGERGLPEATVDQIAERTDGLPLFIEDLTRDALEVAEQQRADGAVSQPPPASGARAIPSTLTDALMSRLDRLGTAKAVAQLGAVIGREFSYELLSRVASVGDDLLRDELARLAGAGLLISRRPAAVLVYSFRHALVRDAAYASLLKKEQAALHARIARVLVEEFPEVAESQPEQLATHFEAARDIDNAVLFLVRAAKLSARRSGFVEAIAQLERALALLAAQTTSEAHTRLELRVHLALGGIYAEHRGFSSPECGRAYSRALELCRALGDVPEIFSVLSGIGAVEITRAGFAHCRSLAEETLERAARQTAKPPFIMGHLLLGGTLFLTGEFNAACAHLDEALAAYDLHRGEQPGRQVLYVQDQKSTGLCYLALALTMLGHLDRGQRAGEVGLAHAESLGGAHAINFSLCYLAAVHLIQRNLPAALMRGRQSLERAREQGFATWVEPSQAILGAAMVGQGDHAAGLELITSGIRAYSGMEAAAYQPFWISLHAQALAASGQLAQALATLDEAIAIGARTGEAFYRAELWRQKGEILAAGQRNDEAERCLRDAIALARSQQARLFELRSATTLCRLLDAAHRPTALRELLAPARQWFAAATESPDVREAAALLDDAGD